MKKTYYQCTFEQCAPLRIGSGAGDETDSDVIRDRRGCPFIPGTSIAGMLRGFFSEQDANHLFGFIEIAKDSRDNISRSGKPKLVESRILVSDATLNTQKKGKQQFGISHRDSVGLNDRGTAEPGAKFDYEVVQWAEPYTNVLELSDDVTPEQEAMLEEVLRRLISEGVSIGARTTRGFGQMRLKVNKREFFLPAQIDDWLNFDPFDQNCFGGVPLTAQSNGNANHVIIDIDLEMRGSFSVREYTTRLLDEDREEKVSPDYSPLSDHAGQPIIPGTSWGGSFRHHMRDLIREVAPSDQWDRLLSSVDCLFGIPLKKGANKGKKHKSEISFFEASIEESSRYTVTRVAIDRFTNAPSNQALFSSEVAQAGKGNLQIKLPTEIDAEKWPDLAKDYPLLQMILATALFDLDCGLMTIGGEGGIGRGICRISSITVNGQDKTDALRLGKTDFIREVI